MRDFKGTKVLVLDGASRQILGILRGLRDVGCEITTVNGSKLNNGYSSRYPDYKLLIPKEQQENQFPYILEELKRKKYDVMLPISDPSMNMVTQHYDELSQYVRIPFVKRETFLKAYDKQITMEICMDNNIPCPITKRRDQSIDEFIDAVGFPIVAKPRMACGSMGLKIVKSREQLDALTDSGEVVPNEYVFQEFIPQTGEQYNIHSFADGTGNLPSHLVTEKNRWYPIDGGASCMCRTAVNEQAYNDSKKLLQMVGWRSCCEIEMIKDPRDGISKVMEINGRASASIKIMYLAGINVALQMLQLAYGEPVKTYPPTDKEVRMRCLLTDVLWLLQSPDRFKRKPCWFSPVRTHDVIFSIKDPLPFFTFIIESVPNYKKSMSKRRRD
ncbi:MAG: ATP-grasp domain-containing protein [Lachnospiraceae bacterium]|nr:ATP-grasp domain-containing protein [Lachnospiraceae bacterium]